MLKAFFRTVLCSLWVLFFSCTYDKVEVYIDNPTDKAITVVINNNDSIFLQPREFKELGKMNKGWCTMKIENKEVKAFIGNKPIMLNPTLSTYILVLSDSFSTIYGFVQLKNDIVVDSISYTGPFELLSGKSAIDYSEVVSPPNKPSTSSTKLASVTRTDYHVGRFRIPHKKTTLERIDNIRLIRKDDFVRLFDPNPE